MKDKTKKPGSLNLNDIKHGEFLMLEILQVMFGNFLAISKRIRYIDSLIEEINKDPEAKKLAPYYSMIGIFCHEFKRVSEKDPNIAQMIEEGERAAFMNFLRKPPTL